MGMKKLLTKSEFARYCNVSPAAVSKACISGLIEHKGKGRAARVDITLDTNKKYYEAQLKEEPKPEPKPKRKPGRPTSTSKVPTDDGDGSEGGETKVSVEIARIKAQTTKINFEIAVQYGRFILKEVVDKIFGDISSTIANLIHPLPQRLAPDICDICGVSDIKIVLKVEKLLEKELERAIAEVKRVTSESRR